MVHPLPFYPPSICLFWRTDIGVAFCAVFRRRIRDAALKIVEKKYFLRAFWFGTILFLAGISVAYFVIMPPAIKFAEVTAQLMGISSQIWKAEDYFSFVVKFMLGMGLGFELPVVCWPRKNRPAQLLETQGHAALHDRGQLDPGRPPHHAEPFTQVIMAVALQLLLRWRYDCLVLGTGRKTARKNEGVIDV